MSRIRRSGNAAYQKIEQVGGVVLHLDSGAYHQVNEVGALIWDLLEGAPSRSELLAALRTRLDDPPDHFEADVDAFLAALRERDLIVVDSDPEV
jgi:hypothetical protein